MLAYLIGLLRGHPATWGYYIADEPKRPHRALPPVCLPGEEGGVQPAALLGEVAPRPSRGDQADRHRQAAAPGPRGFGG